MLFIVGRIALEAKQAVVTVGLETNVGHRFIVETAEERQKHLLLQVLVRRGAVVV